jgi:hypothetical protein
MKGHATETITKKKIIKYSLIALAAALTLLLAFILPSEYGKDPLGIGGMLGLTKISSASGAQTTQSGPYIKEDSKFLEDSTQIRLLPRQGIEYKYYMYEGSVMLYSWNSTAKISFDFHGEPEGAPKGYYESYELAESDKSDGIFTAPFTGVQGWYWENNAGQTVTITLSTAGYYRVIGDPRKAR